MYLFKSYTSNLSGVGICCPDVCTTSMAFPKIVKLIYIDEYLKKFKKMIIHMTLNFDLYIFNQIYRYINFAFKKLNVTLMVRNNILMSSDNDNFLF